jgi:hypothetical protein
MLEITATGGSFDFDAFSNTRNWRVFEFPFFSPKIPGLGGGSVILNFLQILRTDGY